MLFADYHTHSVFSPDSGADIEKLVLSALSKGLTEIAITDHVDLEYPPVDYDPGSGIDYEPYSAEIERVRQVYEGDIRILLGAEAGLQKKSEKTIRDYFSGKHFDFVIGSTHVVDFKDLYDGTFFIGKTYNEAITEYFTDVTESICRFSDLFHVYGHLDCIVRYGGLRGNLEYAGFAGVIDEALKALISRGKGIEVNSSGLRYGLCAPHPRFEILKRYKELGGEIITTGSDAHRAGDVAADFDYVYDMLKSAGFKAVTVFREGAPHFVDI